MTGKHNFTKGFTFCIFIAIMTAAIVLSGCGAQPKPDTPAASTAAPTAGTEATVPETTPVETPADTPRQNALRAYQELLTSRPALEGEHIELEDLTFGYDENLAKFGEHYDYFALWDLNQDGVPELIAMTIVNNRWTPVSVFTFSSGEAVLLKDPSAPESHATFELVSTAGGAYELYLCRDNHIHSVWSGNTPIGFVKENYAYALNGTALVPVDCTLGESEAAAEITARFFDAALLNTETNRNAVG